ncbi:MAG: hypothetical protein H0Z39_07620 [Peptococcaceae bacterium]|nr:hypothetical protein [Peptococcaceae bacterium]
MTERGKDPQAQDNMDGIILDAPEVIKNRYESALAALERKFLQKFQHLLSQGINELRSINIQNLTPATLATVAAAAQKYKSSVKALDTEEHEKLEALIRNMEQDLREIGLTGAAARFAREEYLRRKKKRKDRLVGQLKKLAGM